MIACVFILTAGANGGGSDLGSSIGYVTNNRTKRYRGVTSKQIPSPHHSSIFLALVSVRLCPLCWQDTVVTAK